MENRINIAELLKDCPKDMKLDCTMFEDVYFDCIDDDVSDIIKCYIQDSKHKIGISFSKYGHYSNISKTKCVIFPKGKTSWEGFQRPAKDGDVVVCEEQKMITQMFVVQSEHKEGRGKCYFGYNFECNDFFEEGTWEWDRLATEEERQKLFDAIRVKERRWNEETKTLEKLVVHNFKVGDKIKHKYNNTYCTLGEYSDGISAYRTNIGLALTYKDLEHWELVPDKFDINTLEIFESKVLVRDGEDQNWRPAIFGGFKKEIRIPYIAVGGSYFKYLIPYEGNEHLLLSKNDCDEFYKTWE